MLKIGADELTDSLLAYSALRVSFLETLERIALADQVGLIETGEFGYLTEVPFLRTVAPQVQLDALLCTWRKLRDDAPCRGDLIDESVIYAACETAARVVEHDPEAVDRLLCDGPRVMDEFADEMLGDRLRLLHLNLSNDGDFLLISQFQDVHPDEGRRLKAKFGIDEQDCQPMFDLLGRWHLSPPFWSNAKGLLTKRELSHAASILKISPSSLPL